MKIGKPQESGTAFRFRKSFQPLSAQRSGEIGWLSPILASEGVKPGECSELSEQVNDLNQPGAVNGLPRVLNSEKLICPQQISRRQVERVHRAHTGTGGFAAGPFENEPDIVKHNCPAEVLLIEAILQIPLIEQRLRATLMPDERTTQENSIRIFQYRQSLLSRAGLTVVACDQYAGIGKRPNNSARA
jgi:hypothetical protein